MNFSLNTRISSGFGFGTMTKEGLKAFTSFFPKIGWSGLNSKETLFSRAISEDMKLATSVNPIKAKTVADRALSIQTGKSFGQFSELNGSQVPIEQISSILQHTTSYIPNTIDLSTNINSMQTMIHNNPARALSLDSTSHLRSPKSVMVERLLFQRRIGHYT